MPTRLEKRVAVLLSVLFAFMFHRHPVGLNLLLFDVVILIWLHRSRRISLRSRNSISVYAGVWISALAVVFSYSTFAVVIHILTFILFIGLTLAPEVRSLPNAFMLALSNVLRAPAKFFSVPKDGKPRGAFWRYVWRFRIFVIPLLVIALFVAFYSGSNPFFNNITVYVGEHISETFSALFSRIDAGILLTWALGVFVSLFVVMHYVDLHWAQNDAAATETLQRKRRRVFRKTGMNALRNELRAAVFLLAVLNLIILLLNGIDIYWVWFNFEWNGAYLKQFVHEGTYLLILSILVSVVIVLYFFRNNLNHYRKNKTLRILSYLWLAQNAVLVVSVAIRNFWYIHYFALAYKRIGVIVFLLLTLYGIYTVWQKVHKQKTGYYLLRTNSYALFVLMILCTVPNWDVWIARYNFSRYRTAFVHLNFLADLSDKALPELDKTPEELAAIQQTQDGQFDFGREQTLYLSPVDYHHHIEYRKTAFLKKWEEKSWLSWNLPEYLAYRKLKK